MLVVTNYVSKASIHYADRDLPFERPLPQSICPEHGQGIQAARQQGGFITMKAFTQLPLINLMMDLQITQQVCTELIIASSCLNLQVYRAQLCPAATHASNAAFQHKCG